MGAQRLQKGCPATPLVHPTPLTLVVFQDASKDRVNIIISKL